MQVAILAGGLATRLGHLTTTQPKSMVRVQGKPFLEYQLEFLKACDIEDVVLCTGHLGEQIESYFGHGQRFGMRIKYSREPRLLGTAGALKNAEDSLEDVFIALYGDSYLMLDFHAASSFFRSANKLALMTVYRNNDHFDQSNTSVMGDLVTRYSKKDKTPDMVYIDYGASMFHREVLQMIPEKISSSLEDLFPRLIARGELVAFEVTNRFYEIGSVQGLREFTQFVRDGGLSSAPAKQGHAPSR